jgi:hypothetical protein
METDSKDLKLPSNEIMQNAAKLSIVEDKPILLDYWIASLENKAKIGQKDNASKDKLLVKGADEFTSNIEHIYHPKGTNEYIIITENSIYIVSSSIQKRMISSKSD